MKLLYIGSNILPVSVAPYVGAWIETLTKSWLCKASQVAPYVGAWIETIKEDGVASGNGSRTLRGCVD